MSNRIELDPLFTFMHLVVTRENHLHYFADFLVEKEPVLTLRGFSKRQPQLALWMTTPTTVNRPSNGTECDLVGRLSPATGRLQLLSKYKQRWTQETNKDLRGVMLAELERIEGNDDAR